jgi:NADPH:quinone reductase-like Zn-dependent oxidoreductase
MRPVISKVNRADLETLKKMTEDGKVRPVVDWTFALNEAADAVRYLERGHPKGKVVVAL